MDSPELNTACSIQADATVPPPHVRLSLLGAEFKTRKLSVQTGGVRKVAFTPPLGEHDAENCQRWQTFALL